MTVRTTYSKLRAYTDEATVVEELQQYLLPAFNRGQEPLPTTEPLPDAPMVATWKQYLAEAQTDGVFAVLKRYLVQFQFPIVTGISETEAYRQATRRGLRTATMPEASGLALRKPDHLQLFLHPSIAGQVPVLVAEERGDFEQIVQALCYRNEPRPLPASMGAVFVKGLNNWDRIRRLRESLRGLPLQQNWQQQKDQYQDSLIILSRIPYSNVSAAQMQLTEEEWLDYSLKIRLKHECAHYFTLRYFQQMNVNMYDELIADYLGICAVSSHFRADWFMHFIGLEKYPQVRPDGRVNNYLGAHGLSPAAAQVLHRMLYQAAHQVELFDRQIHNTEDPSRIRRLNSLCSHDLLELAAPDGHQQLLKTYKKQAIGV